MMRRCSEHPWSRCRNCTPHNRASRSGNRLERSSRICGILVVALFSGCSGNRGMPTGLIDGNPQPNTALPRLIGIQDEPRLCIFVTAVGEVMRPLHLEPAVILAVWEDGQVVWSKNAVEGGSPYLVGKIDPRALTDVLAKLDNLNLFRDPRLSSSYYGPDSLFTVIAVADQHRQLRMESWHELAESNPKVVATSRGIMSLDSRTRDSVIAAEPEEYRTFRRAWKEIRDIARGLVPIDGRPASDLRFILGAETAIAPGNLREEDVGELRH